MPRHNITPEAQHQADMDPDAFLDAADEVLSLGLEKLDASLTPEQVSKMVQRHKEYHALFEARERADTIVQRAYHNRRNPMRDQVRDLIRESEALGDPIGMLPHLRRWEADLGQRPPRP
jgi:hypothetical protein